MNIQAVIFDLDGVIVSTDQLHYRAWKYISDGEDIPFNEEINNSLRGVSRMQSLEIILERAPKIYTPDEKQELSERKNRYYVELLGSLSEADILPEVLKALRELKEYRIHMAIGSSSKNARLILRQIGLENAFDAIADGNDITRSKPFPDVFLSAAEKLGIHPLACMVVEDAAAGIQAAKAAGMTVAAIGDAVNSSEADFWLKSMVELAEIIRGINRV